MPNLNRRHLLQLTCAASIAPALPALSAGSTVSKGASASKLLWASMYKNAGSLQNATGLAHSIGVSGPTAQGVFAKLVNANLVTAHAGTRLGRAISSASKPARAPVSFKTVPSQSIKVDVKKFLLEDPDAEVESPEVDDQHTKPS